MERCTCGARVTPSAAWCPLCHQRLDAVAHGVFDVGDGIFDTAHGVFAPATAGDLGAALRTRRSATPPPLRTRRSRWASSEITFGPIGRVVASILVTLPLLFFVPSLVGFGGAGLVIYVPLWIKALREIWARASVVLEEGSPAPGH